MELILLLCIVLVSNALEPVQFTLSTMGNQFQSANAVELLTTSFNIRTPASCAMLCYQHSLCLTFDFDFNSKQCRLFEGSVDTGTILPAPFSSVVVGWINIDASMYYSYNATYDKCVNNRFLYSNILTNLCECPIHTFWNGSMCLNQRYTGDVCESDNWCRTDLNIECISLVCVGKKYLLKYLR
jgi:hypothetical protein